MKYVGSGLVKKVSYSDNVKVIEVRLIRISSNTAQTINVPPLDQNLVRLPLQGEIVPVYSAPTETYGRHLKSERLYYGSPIAVSGESSVNLLEPYDPSENLFQATRLPMLQRYDGDTVIEGRGQGHIRITSTPPQESNKYIVQRSWKSGETTSGDPLLVITNGSPRSKLQENFTTHRVENINEDFASLYLTSGQDLGLVQPFTGDLNLLKGLSDSNKLLVDSKTLGSEAILTANRVGLISKERDLLLSSKKTLNILSNESVSILSNQSVFLEAPKILLGSAAMLEHGEKFYSGRSESFAKAVKGDSLLEVLESILQVLEVVISRDSTLSSEKLSIQKVRGSLNKILSNKVFLE